MYSDFFCADLLAQSLYGPFQDRSDVHSFTHVASDLADKALTGGTSLIFL
jgi:hypothetical protein